MSGAPGDGDAVLSELCTICHIDAPKYRCPRCSTRTCSLPCTRRHKLWSQCSGVRDPAAYLKRHELATPSSFDRDFNFITGIERTLERAERDVEHRGIPVPAKNELEFDRDQGGNNVVVGKKRKREMLAKGEAGFLRGAEAGGVRVVRAPRGLSRNKLNGSKWHPKHKCLSWTVEWVAPDGQRTTRNCLETCTVAEAYDRVYPPPKEEKQCRDTRGGKVEGGLVASQAQTDSTITATSLDSGNQGQSGQEDAIEATPEKQAGEEVSDTTANEEHTPSVSVPEATMAREASTAETSQSGPSSQQQPLSPSSPSPHRNIYFYLHRPRTTGKQTVLIPLHPSATFAAALRDRLVLEFPTIYVLPHSPEELSQPKEAEEAGNSEFLLEEEYLRIYGPTPDEDQKANEGESDEDGEEESNEAATRGLADVDEKKVLEVLKQDLFGDAPVAAASELS